MDSVETAMVSLAGTSNGSPASQREFLARCLVRVKQLDQVQSAAAIDFLPLTGNSVMAATYKVQSRPEPELAVLLSATPDLIRTIGISILAGRDFLPSDTASSLPVAIVNESFAKLDGGVQLAIGKKLRPATGSKDKVEAPLIVGVVQDFRFAGPAEDKNSAVFRPFAQSTRNYFTLAARRRAGGVGLAKVHWGPPCSRLIVMCRFIT